MTQIDDGGPAFPQSASINPESDDRKLERAGMSLRDWFAGQALAGLANQSILYQRKAEMCYEMADDMLKARDLKYPYDWKQKERTEQ